VVGFRVGFVAGAVAGFMTGAVLDGGEQLRPGARPKLQCTVVADETARDDPRGRFTARAYGIMTA
jgi:hypothetical protein